MRSRYRRWEERYKQLGGRGISPVQGQITHESSLNDYLSAEKALQAYLREWFNQQSFRSLEYQIRALSSVRQDESVPAILKIDSGNTQDDIKLLRRIPWNFWSLFDALGNAEVVLSTQHAKPVDVLGRPVRILAIFGSSEGGLQLPDDEAALERLRQRGAEITCLQQPSDNELQTYLWGHAWDILFFAGHSYSEPNLTSGFLLIRDGEFRSLDSLRNAIQQAVNRGLKLAIFNSCDGLGIANSLAYLGVPTMIVMREPVPDLVARRFLEYFLEEFSSGTPLYRAVRQARSRLQWLENDCSCLAATRLPVICQNPVQPQLVWPNPQSNSTSRFPSAACYTRTTSTKAIRWKWIALVGMAPLVIFAVGKFAIDRFFPPAPTLSASANLSGISLGEEILITTEMTAEKQAGRDAFARGDYRAAQKHFTASLQQQRNDP